MNKIGLRLKQVIDSQKVSVSEFEKAIGCSHNTISRIINDSDNKKDIGSKWLRSIANNYPDISLHWLITGEGQMLRQKIISAVAGRDINNAQVGNSNQAIWSKEECDCKAVQALLKEKERVILLQEKVIAALEQTKTPSS